MSSIQELTPPVEAFVKTHHSNVENYDGSHDYTHIQRVAQLARKIYADIIANNPEAPKYNWDIIYFSCILHDVGDRKYLPEIRGTEEMEEVIPKEVKDAKRAPALVKIEERLRNACAEKICIDPNYTPENLVFQVLLSLGASEDLVNTIQEILTNVSYTREKSNPERAAAFLEEHPELAVVQDADGLDAIGATGTARLFLYNGSNTEKDLKGIMEIFDAKIIGRLHLMKTAYVKREAEKRGDRLKRWRAWFVEEGGMGVEGMRDC